MTNTRHAIKKSRPQASGYGTTVLAGVFLRQAEQTPVLTPMTITREITRHGRSGSRSLTVPGFETEDGTPHPPAMSSTSPRREVENQLGAQCTEKSDLQLLPGERSRINRARNAPKKATYNLSRGRGRPVC